MTHNTKINERGRFISTGGFMPCIQIKNGFVCTNRWGRLHLPGKYIWVEFHAYCGPTFWQDADGTKAYDAKEGDPIWPLFDKWLSKSVRAV